MKRSLLIMSAASAAALVLSGCGGKREAQPAEGAAEGECVAASGQMTMATGNSTGVYYVLGGGLSKIVSDNTDISMTAAETGASVQNMEQLAAGDYDVAFSLADTAADAVAGNDSFTEPLDTVALTRIYDNYTQVIVRKDADIESVEDFEGKTVSTGSPKSGTEVIANRLIEAAGLEEGDVNAQRIDLTKTVDSMKDGTIDAMVWSGGLPTAGVTDLFTSAGDDVEILDISDLIEPMQELNEVYEVAELQADTYGEQEAVETIVTPNVLMVRSDMDNGTACAITKLVYDKHDDLVAVHAAAEGIEESKAAEVSPIELHPGAQQALDELGGE